MGNECCGQVSPDWSAEMNNIERLDGDELVMSSYRPFPVSGLRKGPVKAMNPGIEAIMSGSATAAGDSPALGVIRRVLETGRSVLQGLRTPDFAPWSIEQELSGFLKQFSNRVVRCKVSVAGHSKQLQPAIHEQINLIGREALVNALLHSEATRIEAEVEYLPRRLRVVVRDNGRGIDPRKARTRSDVHWDLVGMRNRAESIGAKLTVWSRSGAGTEVEISVPSQALAEACA
jgi:signal transduction histidine kinase